MYSVLVPPDVRHTAVAAGDLVLFLLRTPSTYTFFSLYRVINNVTAFGKQRERRWLYATSVTRETAVPLLEMILSYVSYLFLFRENFFPTV